MQGRRGGSEASADRSRLSSGTVASHDLEGTRPRRAWRVERGRAGPDWGCKGGLTLEEIRPPRCEIKDSCSAMGADMGSRARGGGHGSIAVEVMFKSARGYLCGRSVLAMPQLVTPSAK